MAIQDFTKYLGAQVKFTYKPYDGSSDEYFAKKVDTVEGIITEVLITQSLENCNFLLDGEFYDFDSVDFVDVLLIPEVAEQDV
jgi:hypothetical protein|tara:strand:- start:1467 stop:1715 length:249 start_codon:yes stop_codon:yes gene_type:complete